MPLTQEQHYTQDLQQEQTITHQQIQALELLAAPMLDLRTAITEEMEKNPVLEIENNEKVDEELPSEEETAPEENEDWLDQLLELEDKTYRGPSVRRVSKEEEKRRQHFLNSISVKKTSHDTLLEQLSFLNLDEELREQCEMIVDSLDTDGYFAGHPADLAMVCGASMDEIEKAISVVQSCEPAGVAARNLRERLLIQIRRKGLEDSLAHTLVRDHLDDIAGNRILKLVKTLDRDLEEIRTAVLEIQELNPHIEWSGSEDSSQYVEAEVTVLEKKGKLTVRLNNTRFPSLRISSVYRKLLADPSSSNETREYIKEKIRSAAVLINSLAQRQTTLGRIAEAIVEKQAGYFRDGIGKMKPLTMAEVAEKVGVHETTVSRGVAAKYLRCKHGLIPLRNSTLVL